MRRRRLPWFVVLGLGLVAVGCSGSRPPRAVDGVVDLTTWDLGARGPVPLDGAWEFHWERLLEPGDLEGTAAPAPSAMARVPGAWNGIEVAGRPLPRDGFGTYRLRIRLRETGDVLAVSIRYMSTAYRLWIDGRPVAANGRVGRSAPETRPQFRPVVAHFAPAGPTVTLVAQVANFHHRVGGVWNRLELGTAAQIHERRSQDLAFATILLGGILVMGIYHLGLYGLRREDRSALWFAAFCLVIAVRVVVMGELLLPRLWPDFPWEALLRIEYLTGYLALPLFYMFVAALFPAEMPRVLLRLAQATGGALALVDLILPVRLTSLLIPAYEIVLVLFVLAAAGVLVRAALRRREGARMLLAGGGTFLAAVLHDLLRYNQIVLTPELLPFGLVVMILSQSGVLARRFSEAFRRQTALARENAGLLADLRRHVDELGRSRRLLGEQDDKVRKEIAEFLHGHVQTRLLVAWQWLEQALGLLQPDAAQARALVTSARREVQQVQEEDVRAVSHRLHPSIIDVGLVPAARSLADGFGDYFQVTVEVDPELAALDGAADDGLPPEVRLAAYRILEEALGNVVAHAAAGHVRIGLGVEARARLLLRVEDDGRGLDPARVAPGLGLGSIAARVGDLGGTWDLAGAPGRGAVLSATLPLSRPSPA